MTKRHFEMLAVIYGRTLARLEGNDRQTFVIQCFKPSLAMMQSTNPRFHPMKFAARVCQVESSERKAIANRRALAQ